MRRPPSRASNGDESVAPGGVSNDASPRLAASPRARAWPPAFPPARRRPASRRRREARRVFDGFVSERRGAGARRAGARRAGGFGGVPPRARPRVLGRVQDAASGSANQGGRDRDRERTHGGGRGRARGVARLETALARVDAMTAEESRDAMRAPPLASSRDSRVREPCDDACDCCCSVVHEIHDTRAFVQQDARV